MKININKYGIYSNANYLQDNYYQCWQYIWQVERNIFIPL